MSRVKYIIADVRNGKKICAWRTDEYRRNRENITRVEVSHDKDVFVRFWCKEDALSVLSRIKVKKYEVREIYE